MIRDDYPYVTLATVFLDHDRPPQYLSGLLRGDLSPKPAGEDFARFMHSTGR